VPGGTGGAALLGAFPALLIGLAVWDQAGKWQREDLEDPIAPAAALLLGTALAALGPLLYLASRRLSKHSAPPTAAITPANKPDRMPEG
jgi:hypothetical protein